MELRPYQAAVIESARRALTTKGSVVIQMPTGAGKTKVASAMLAEADGAAWFICHRVEILRQAAKAFSAAGIEFGVVSPRAEPDYSKPVQIVSVDALVRRMADLPLPSMVFWDECHHVAAKSWARIREQLAGAKHIGLTATPERLDGKGLSQWFEELVVGPSTRELIDDGWLSDFRYFAPSEPDLTSAKLRAGDYRKEDVAKAMNMPVLIGDAIAEYRQRASGKRALVFCASVEASKALVERFNAEGIPAAHVDGTTPDEARTAAVEALAAGHIKVLSNVEVFTEGFDLPAIDAVILLRPTKSLALFLQMIGRVLRKAHGKDVALIFDHAGLWLEHGWFDAGWEWSLEGGARKNRLATVEHGPRRCPECKEVRGERIEQCRCGYKFQTGREVGEHDGDLIEIKSRRQNGYVLAHKMKGILQLSEKEFRELSRVRRYGRFVDPREEISELRRLNLTEIPPIFSSRRNFYVDSGTFCSRYKISIRDAERLLGHEIKRHSNGWIDTVWADKALSEIRKNYQRLADLNTTLGQARINRFIRHKPPTGLPLVSSSRCPQWVHTQTALKWVRDNTNIKIPPEAWPAQSEATANDNVAATAQAEAA